MPSQNVIKAYGDGVVYHAYNRGVEKRPIFRDSQDFKYFEDYFAKYLGNEVWTDTQGRPYPKLNDRVELLAYCLMPNHFHLVLRQVSQRGMIEFMRRLQTGYAMYFNQKYHRIGPLFQGKYKASSIDNDAYLKTVAAYVHRNPDDYQGYPFSSFRFHQSGLFPSWLKPAPVLEQFASNDEYLDFVGRAKSVTDDGDDDPLILHDADILCEVGP